MATLYTEIYDVFLSKISDYSFINLTQIQLEEQLETYLKSAITKFRTSKTNLQDRDEVNNQFNNTLHDDEREILATFMIVEHLKPEILSSKVYKQVMTDKEFKMYSQANHLREMLEMYNLFKKEAEKLMTDYSFKYLDWRNFK
jgi:hypothetical protein